MSSSVTVVLLASDLMLSSTVSGFASSAALPFRCLSSHAEVADLATANPDMLLLIDLGCPGLDVASLASSIPPVVLATAVAYGPHVHTARLQQATDAGFGQVMSRGQFSAQVGRLIADAAQK